MSIPRRASSIRPSSVSPEADSRDAEISPGEAYRSVLRQQREHAKRAIEAITATFIEDLQRMHASIGISATPQDDREPEGGVLHTSLHEQVVEDDELLTFEDELRQDDPPPIIPLQPSALETDATTSPHGHQQLSPMLTGTPEEQFPFDFELPLLEGELPLPPPNQEAHLNHSGSFPPEESSESQSRSHNAAIEQTSDLRPGLLRTQLLHFPRATFPSRSPVLTRRVAQLFRILEEVYRCLCSDTRVTKRDIYYRAPSLFDKQATVDRLVDTIAHSLGVDRLALGITATAKGLIAGTGSLNMPSTPGGNQLPVEDLSTTSVQGSLITLSHERSTLLPGLEDLDRVETSASWALVVEKDAVFQALVQAGLTRGIEIMGATDGAPAVSQAGILVTAKGYPDIATRQFLARLMDEQPMMRMFLLVDADPYGLDISEQYRVALSSEAMHRFSLLGVLMSDLADDGADGTPQREEQDQDSARTAISADVTLPLALHDYKKATSMLHPRRRPSLSSAVRDQLHIMLSRRLKAEIEGLTVTAERRDLRSARITNSQEQSHAWEINDSDGLASYVRSQLQRALQSATQNSAVESQPDLDHA